MAMKSCSFSEIATFATCHTIVHSGQTTLGEGNNMVYVDLVANIELLFTVPAQPSLPCKKKATLKLCETTTHFDNRGGPQKKPTGVSH
jgi:hypothetical protein